MLHPDFAIKGTDAQMTNEFGCSGNFDGVAACHPGKVKSCDEVVRRTSTRRLGSLNDMPTAETNRCYDGVL